MYGFIVLAPVAASPLCTGPIIPSDAHRHPD